LWRLLLSSVYDPEFGIISDSTTAQAINVRL
jgi:hypothetical protein